MKKVIDPLKAKKIQIKEKIRFQKISPEYKIDITDNNKTEGIRFIKKDGSDLMVIKNHEGEDVFEYKFSPVGLDSHIFRIRVHQLSEKSKVLIFYYYEGYIQYTTFLATGRLYFLTIDNNDLTTLKMFKGPLFWQESENRFKQYSRTFYSVKFDDYDKDGRQDILVQYHLIKNVFLYRTGGNWKTR